VDVYAAWREGEVYYADVGDGGHGKRRPAKGATSEAIERPLQQAIAEFETLYVLHDVGSFRHWFEG